MPRALGSEQFGLEANAVRSRQESCQDGSRPMSSKQAAEGQAAHAQSPAPVPSVTLTA